MKYLTLLIILYLPGILLADSQQIRVYAISQSYWDIKPGDTLGDITRQVVAGNAGIRSRVMAQIVEMNPQAFIDNDPDKMKANIRLWLPDHTLHSHKALDREKYIVEEFSWGYVQRPR